MTNLYPHEQCRPLHEQRREEVREIYDVIRRSQPDRNTFDVWNEADELYLVGGSQMVLAGFRGQQEGGTRGLARPGVPPS